MKSLARLLSAGLALTILTSACGIPPGFLSTPTPTLTPTPVFTPTPTPDPASLVAASCQGKAVPGAATYQTDHAPHPILFISSTGERHEWNSQLPGEWQPQSLDQVEFVGCLEETETIIETCSYIPVGQADRYQYDLTIRLVIAQTGEELLVFKKAGSTPPKCPAAMSFDLLNPGRKRIDGGHVNLSDVRSQLEIYVAAPTPPRVVMLPEMGYNAVLSPDGRILASDMLNVVTLWDTTTGQKISSLEKHEHHIAALVFSPDGKILATRDGYGTIIVWDVAAGLPLSILTSSDTGFSFSRMAFTPDSRFLASPVENLITLWDLTTGEQAGQYEGSFAYDLACSPDGKYLAAADLFGVYLWDLSFGQQEPTRIDQWEKSISYIFQYPVAFSLDGKILFYAACSQADEQGSHCLAGEIRLWDIEKNQLITSFSGPAAEVTNIAISPDGNLLTTSFCSQTGYTGCASSQIIIWDLATLKLFYEFEVGGGIKDLVFSTDGRTVISGSDNRTITFWDISWIK
jgi:WD40 repeat protein